MLGSSEWRMPLNVLILEFFSLYFHFSSFLRGKIDTNKRLCLVFRNVLTFRVEEDFLWYKNACRLLCTCGMLTSSFTHFSLRWVQIIIRIIINPFTNQQRTTYEAQVFLVYLKTILALSFRISCISLRLFHVILCLYSSFSLHSFTEYPREIP